MQLPDKGKAISCNFRKFIIREADMVHELKISAQVKKSSGIFLRLFILNEYFGNQE